MEVCFTISVNKNKTLEVPFADFVSLIYESTEFRTGWEPPKVKARFLQSVISFFGVVGNYSRILMKTCLEHFKDKFSGPFGTSLYLDSKIGYSNFVIIVFGAFH